MISDKMRPLVFITLFVAMTCSAEQVEDVIAPLGLSKDDLKDVWHSGRCEPGWSVVVDKAILEKKELLGYKGLNTEFFLRKELSNRTILQAGLKCAALNKYYFQDVVDQEIEQFIKQDKKFIREHGFSVLDAVYIEKTQFFNFNGNVGEFPIKYAKRLVEKGLFTLKEKESEFNGEPSISFSGKRTNAGDQFHDKIYK